MQCEITQDNGKGTQNLMQGNANLSKQKSQFLNPHVLSLSLTPQFEFLFHRISFQLPINTNFISFLTFATQISSHGQIPPKVCCLLGLCWYCETHVRIEIQKTIFPPRLCDKYNWAHLKRTCEVQDNVHNYEEVNFLCESQSANTKTFIFIL